MPFDIQTRVLSPTGARLNLYRRMAAQPRAIIQINHGVAEHAARYARFADLLAERGCSAFAHDHRGHGHTQAPGAPLGRFGTPYGADEVIADIAFIHDVIASENPGVPVIA